MRPPPNPPAGGRAPVALPVPNPATTGPVTRPTTAMVQRPSGQFNLITDPTSGIGCSQQQHSLCCISRSASASEPVPEVVLLSQVVRVVANQRHG